MKAPASPAVEAALAVWRSTAAELNALRERLEAPLAAYEAAHRAALTAFFETPTAEALAAAVAAEQRRASEGAAVGMIRRAVAERLTTAEAAGPIQNALRGLAAAVAEDLSRRGQSAARSGLPVAELDRALAQIEAAFPAGGHANVREGRRLLSELLATEI